MNLVLIKSSEASNSVARIPSPSFIMYKSELSLSRVSVISLYFVSPEHFNIITIIYIVTDLKI